MSSTLDLDQFLAELDLRRQRLLRLIGPSDQHARLLAEVEELSEQLIAAEEELRVQQEQLESTRQALLTLRHERDHQARHASGASVTTDARGVVVEVSQALERMIDPSPVRLTPRPLATWFDVADRRVVRTLINHAAATDEPQYAHGLAVAVGKRRLLVDLAVERLSGPAGTDTLLRWELLPVAPASPSPDPGPDYGALALTLARCQSTDELHTAIVDAARALLPDGGQVGLTVVGARGVPAQAAWSGEPARQLDEAQLGSRTGPLVDALAALGPVPSRGFQAGEVTCAGALAVPLVSGTQAVGVLTLYPGAGGRVDERLVWSAETLSRHVSAALARAAEVANLRTAMLTRQLIGQAVGVLMERHRLTPQAAFEQLRRRSQNTNLKLREVAQRVVETGLSPLEMDGP